MNFLIFCVILTYNQNFNLYLENFNFEKVIATLHNPANFGVFLILLPVCGPPAIETSLADSV